MTACWFGAAHEGLLLFIFDAAIYSSLYHRFPRNQENFDTWFKIMGHCVTLRLVIYLDCSVEKMEERILKRGKASDRVDDNLKSLRRRFDTYRQVHNMQSMPPPPLCVHAR